MEKDVKKMRMMMVMTMMNNNNIFYFILFYIHNIMNTIKILLIIGLVYFAFTQKSLKIRNMLLVVTGLLAFCMFSLEGFQNMEFNGGKASRKKFEKQELPEKLKVGGTITSDNNIITYTFKDTEIPDYSCPEGKLKGEISRENIEILNSSNIEKVFPCVSPQKCSEATGFKCDCGYDKTYKETDICSGAKCTTDDFIKGGTCCDKKPDFCDCLKETNGKNDHCNSGWVRTQKYIKKNSDGTGWGFSNEYWDDDIYKCWPSPLGELHPRLSIFAGKCVVPENTTLDELNKCDSPDPDPDPIPDPETNDDN